MTTQRDQIIDRLKHDKAFLHGVGVRRIGLFGSAVRGDDREDSDLDFVVEFEKASFDGYMDLKFHLEDLFLKKVDLVLTHCIKPALRQRILSEVVYA